MEDGELKYNNSNQAYIVIGNFSLKSNDIIENYVRVRFTKTGHEQVVKRDLENLGQFEDDSLTKDDGDSVDNGFKIQKLETITAINPNGKEVSMPMEELEDFSLNNNLDFEAVQMVVNGHQKTHRRWKFVKNS